MIEIYMHGSPSPRKLSIMLEECDIPYKSHWVNIYAHQHKSPEFLSINPNGRVPALFDPEGPDGPLLLWESMAMILYLAEKTGRFLPRSGSQRYEVLKWASFQATHAPYLGTCHWYRMAVPTPDRYSIDKYALESFRIYQMLDEQLAKHRYVAGDDYSIADISLFPWVEYHDWHGQRLADFPHIERWFTEVLERPAVQRGRAVPYPYGEYGEGPEAEQARAHCESRLHDPDFAPSRFDRAYLEEMMNVAPITKIAAPADAKRA